MDRITIIYDDGGRGEGQRSTLPCRYLDARENGDLLVEVEHLDPLHREPDGTPRVLDRTTRWIPAEQLVEVIWEDE